MAGPRSDGRLAQGFYTQGDQLLTIDNLSLNGFRLATKNLAVFTRNGRGLG
jgi:hypothetical protein